MTDNIGRFLFKKIGTDEAYTLGVDCGLHGANLVNCNFKIFSSPENTKAWERGKKEGEESKKDGVERMKTFDEEEAIRITEIARPIVKADALTMFSSEEDMLIYEHFFINGMEHANSELVESLKAMLEIIDSNSEWKFNSELESIKKARVLLENIRG